MASSTSSDPTDSPSNTNLEVLAFAEGGKSESPEKNPWSKDKNQQQIQRTYKTESGNRTRSHWWEASALITASSLLPH